VEPCTALQDNSQTKLWVVIIHCLADLCDPFGRSELENQLCNDNVKATTPLFALAFMSRMGIETASIQAAVAAL
jgi:hypothetical protein